MQEKTAQAIMEGKSPSVPFTSQHLGSIVQLFLLNTTAPKIVTPAKLVPAQAGSRGREVRFDRGTHVPLVMYTLKGKKIPRVGLAARRDKDSYPRANGKIQLVAL